MVDHLRLRNFILCFVGADSYAFVHRTFLEYFCAVEIVHQFNVAKTLDIDGLIALFDEHCRPGRMARGASSDLRPDRRSVVGRIVERLATRTELDKWDGYTALPELPLAIWCLSEIRGVSKYAGAGTVLCARARGFLSGSQETNNCAESEVMRPTTLAPAGRMKIHPSSTYVCRMPSSGSKRTGRYCWRQCFPTSKRSKKWLCPQGGLLSVPGHALH